MLDSRSAAPTSTPIASLAAWLPQIVDTLTFGMVVLDTMGRCHLQNNEAKRLMASGKLSLSELTEAALNRLDDLRRTNLFAHSNGKIVHVRDHRIPSLLELQPLQCGLHDLQLTLIPLTDGIGKPGGVAVKIEEMTKCQVSFRTLLYQATHDELTGLVNRRVFMERLRQLATRQDSGEHSLFFMDLDKFKAVNDRAGHLAGDEILKQAGHVLGSHVRHRDTLARLGGDEFGLIMEHCPSSNASEVAHQLCLSIRNHDFCWNNQHFSLGISIGIVAVSGAHRNFDLLIAAADSACYRSKSAGGCCAHAYQNPVPSSLHAV